MIRPAARRVCPPDAPTVPTGAARGEQRIPMDELVDRQDVYGCDALAWTPLADDRADAARAQMAELH